MECVRQPLLHTHTTYLFVFCNHFLDKVTVECNWLLVKDNLRLMFCY